MCKALEDIKLEGIEEGRVEGRKRAIKDLIQKKLAKDQTIPDIAEALEEEESTIASLIEEMKAVL